MTPDALNALLDADLPAPAYLCQHPIERRVMEATGRMDLAGGNHDDSITVTVIYEKPQTCPDHGRPLTWIADRSGNRTLTCLACEQQARDYQLHLPLDMRRVTA